MKNLSLLVLLLCTMLNTTLTYAAGKRVNAHLEFDTDVQIMSNKSVSLRAQCISDDSGTSRIRLYATTTSGTGTVLDGADDFSGTGGDFLLPTTLPEDSVLLQESIAKGSVRWDNDIDDGFVLDTSDIANKNKVRGLAVDGESAALGITLDGCYISVLIEKINKFKTLKP